MCAVRSTPFFKEIEHHTCIPVDNLTLCDRANDLIKVVVDEAWLRAQLRDDALKVCTFSMPCSRRSRPRPCPQVS